MSNSAAKKTEQRTTTVADITKADTTEDINGGDKSQLNEKSLIEATRLLMREHGIRKSAAAIRDAVEMPHQIFEAPQAVSALSNLGFKASFGDIKLNKLTKEHFPLIAFAKDGDVLFLKTISDDDTITFSKFGKTIEAVNLPKAEFKKIFSGFVLIAKELSSSEAEERSGHWFFSAFRKSKWLYIQVMIAAMVSNFLSLSVSLFTITVYDRIIPNSAFESLLALSIGVVSTGFDFLIRG